MVPGQDCEETDGVHKLLNLNNAVGHTPWI